MTPEQIASVQRLWQVAGWTMVHFFWVGLLLGLLAMLVRVALRRTPPKVRYAASLMMFGTLVVAPAIIAWMLLPTVPIPPIEATSVAPPSGVSLAGPVAAANTPLESQHAELLPPGAAPGRRSGQGKSNLRIVSRAAPRPAMSGPARAERQGKGSE